MTADPERPDPAHPSDSPTPPPPSPAPQGGTGLAPNVAGALSYLLGPVTGIIFLVLEKHSSFVRFHAAQSIGIFVAFFIFWIAVTVVSMILNVIPVIGFIVSVIMIFVSLLVGLGGLVLWLFLMYQAFQGNEWEFPWVGPQSRRILGGG